MQNVFAYVHGNLVSQMLSVIPQFYLKEDYAPCQKSQTWNEMNVIGRSPRVGIFPVAEFFSEVISSYKIYFLHSYLSMRIQLMLFGIFGNGCMTGIVEAYWRDQLEACSSPARGIWSGKDLVIVATIWNIYIVKYQYD